MKHLLAVCWAVPSLVVLLAFLLPACAVTNPRTGDTSMQLRFDNGVCSGTAVGPHAILTATHCLKYKTLVVRGHTILIVAQSFKRWSRFGTVPVRGESVYAIGSPAGLPGIYSSGNDAGTSTDDNGHSIYLFNLPTWFGDSGAAIYGSNGGIVATVSEILTLNDGRAALYMVIAFPFNFTDKQLAEAAR